MNKFFSLLMAIFILTASSVSFAGETYKIVADCLQKDYNLGYKIYQKGNDLDFKAVTLDGKTKFDVDLAFRTANSIVWVAPMSSKHKFTLMLTLSDTNSDGTDGMINVDGYHGHIRCKLY